MRIRIPLALAICILLAMGTSCVQAQTLPTGDENPTANTGALKAQIETGGSYSAHSGNATRVIPDLHVPGTVGVYGLDFVRYYNSLRNDRDPGSTYLHPEPIPEQPADFGSPGWSHSWSWVATYDEYLQEVGGDGGDEIYTMSITITFPDGHASKYKIFRTKNWPYGQPWPPDPRFGPPYIAEHGEAKWTPSGRIHDSLERMAEDGSEFWLYRADGGAVHFVDSTWGYQAREVFDPHGLITTLSYDANGHLYQVEQEGGKRLIITWNSGVIQRVENAGSAGYQAVEYGYSWLGGWLTLVSANYQNDPVPGQVVSSVYTYQEYVPPSGFFYAGPLLIAANDPRFNGPMRFISYTYRGTGCRPQGQPQPGYSGGQHDYFYASPTSIAEERNGGNGVTASGFAIGCFDGTRTDDNGLGGHRKFFYGHSVTWPGSGSLGYELAKVTDFNDLDPLAPGVPFQRQSNLNGHPYEVWDGRGIKTRLTHADGSGLPSEIRHVGSDGSFSSYDRINPGNSDAPDVTRVPNPYPHWLFSKTDEGGLTTTYRRDERRRVTDIIYPDTSSEHFSYNALNQVTSHTLASGAVKHCEYNGLNQLQREWNSVDGEAAATTYTYYGIGNHPEWTGLVATVRNARAALNGAAYSTMMEYNGRQQIIKVHYPPTGGITDPYVEYIYDDYGNCTAITDELGYHREPGQLPDPAHTRKFTYDDYGRCTSYTEPLNAPGWTGNQDPATFIADRTWTWIYDRWIDGVGQRDAYAHTKNEWRIQIEPAFNAAGDRRMTARAHDVENRVIIESTGWIQPAGPIGNWYFSADGENHFFSYDENGQKSSYTDPQGRLTTYDYDLRNRLWKTNETVNTIPRTTETLYDVTGNNTLVTFPDTRTQQWLDYDAFGQAWTFIDEAQ